MNPALDRRLLDGLQVLGLCTAEHKRHACLAFIELLCRWNKTYNLSAIRDPLDMVSRHVLDSLSIAPYLCGERFLDLGSGAGFPGIPLAIWFPQHQFHLLDGNGKKMRFLFEVKQSLQLQNVVLHNLRAEDLHDEVGFDCILSRAFASLADMLQVSAHLCAPGGCFLAMKAKPQPQELQEVVAPYTIDASWQLRVPGVEASRQLLKITCASQRSVVPQE